MQPQTCSCLHGTQAKAKLTAVGDACSRGHADHGTETSAWKSVMCGITIRNKLKHVARLWGRDVAARALPLNAKKITIKTWSHCHL